MKPRPLVLCVDDYKPGLLTRQVFLEQFGFEVLIASSGPEALDIISSQNIDAVVMDYRMPGMDGEELALRIREISQEMPLLLLSGFVREIPERLKKSVDRYLTKGDSPRLLISALDELTATTPQQRRMQKQISTFMAGADKRSQRGSS